MERHGVRATYGETVMTRTLSIPLPHPNPLHMERESGSANYDIICMDKIFNTILILLWTYTGLDKLIRWEASRNAFLPHPSSRIASLGTGT
ncbi:hypothetical protein [Algoriphagus sp.]